MSAHELDSKEHGRIILVSCPYKKSLSNELIETDGDLAVVLMDKNNKVKSWCLVRGSFLKINGKEIVSGSKKEWRKN